MWLLFTNVIKTPTSIRLNNTAKHSKQSDYHWLGLIKEIVYFYCY